MATSKVLSVRLKSDMHFRYEMRAAAAGLSLSAYVSQLVSSAERITGLEKHDLLFDEIDGLKMMLETATDMIKQLQNHIENGVHSGESNASLQTLLMLRIMARPEHIDTFNKQVSSLRLKPISFSR
jgi:hypothetical protein